MLVHEFERCAVSLCCIAAGAHGASVMGAGSPRHLRPPSATRSGRSAGEHGPGSPSLPVPRASVEHRPDAQTAARPRRPRRPAEAAEAAARRKPDTLAGAALD